MKNHLYSNGPGRCLPSVIASFVFYRRGYAEAEIEAVFAKYDADGDRVLNAEEQKAMHDDLEEQRKNIDGEINQVSWLVMSL